MTKKFLTPVAPPALESDPTGGVEGAIYFNSATNALKFYNGTNWVELSQAGGPTSASSIRSLSTAPSSPAQGDVYFDTVEKTVKMYNGVSWYDVGGPKALLSHVHNYDGTVGYVKFGEFVPDSTVSYDAGGAYSTQFNDILDGGGA